MPKFDTIFQFNSQGNGPVGQVDTSPEILLVYTAHLVMIAHKILAASTAQGCEKIAQSWNVQFKFAQPRTRMTAVCLAVTLYSPVHSNGSA
jgi:hypothetical protein